MKKKKTDNFTTRCSHWLENPKLVERDCFLENPELREKEQ